MKRRLLFVLFAIVMLAFSACSRKGGSSNYMDPKFFNGKFTGNSFTADDTKTWDSSITYKATVAKDGLYIQIVKPEQKLRSGTPWSSPDVSQFMMWVDITGHRGNYIIDTDYKFLFQPDEFYLFSRGYAWDVWYPWDRDKLEEPAFNLVITYEGTLDDNSDTDVGYTVNIFIPWSSAGLTKAPAHSNGENLKYGFSDF
jgi:hypothetical protein